MTHASSLPLPRSARRRFPIERGAIVAALFFLAVFAAEMAFILPAALRMDPATLMSFVT